MPRGELARPTVVEGKMGEAGLAGAAVESTLVPSALLFLRSET